MSLRSTPARRSAALAASTARLSRPRPSSLPNGVEPVPVMTTSRMARVLLQRLPELSLQDLTIVVLRQRLDEPVKAGPFEPCNIVEAELLKRPLVHQLAGFRHDEGDHFLPPFRMGAPDHRGLHHPAMLQKHLFDLARIDVRAARNDHILGPILQRQETLLIHRAEVPGP